MRYPFSRNAGATVTLGIACALSLGQAQSADFRLGAAIEAAQAERSITITPDARWANVKQGESVRFISGQRSFGWKFDGTLSAFDLATVAPADFFGRPFVVYVAPTPQGRRAN